MTTKARPLIGASSACGNDWDTIDWKTAEKHVRRLQTRIAKAAKLGKIAKVKALQWILTHSWYAKLLAVRRVTQNKGSKTAGIDNVIWNTSKKKISAVFSLKRRGYKTQPLRRIYIPKKDGRKRPLSIPVMNCRAQQALYLQALEPVVEMNANRNSYGFRPKRSTADAIQHCHRIVGRKGSPEWIFEGDIKSCFDKISHSWLKKNIIMDTSILSKWLEAGYVEKGMHHQSTEGTPQGGIISPTLLQL